MRNSGKLIDTAKLEERRAGGQEVKPFNEISLSKISQEQQTDNSLPSYLPTLQPSKPAFTLSEGATHVETRKGNRQIAFTLVEVLITLAIVGVVSAMTLPTVINKINDHNFKVAYKKAYRDVNEAYRMMKATDDEFEEIVCNSSITDYCATRAFGRNFELLAKQFKATKTCFRSNNDKKYKCLKCSNYSAHECYTNDASAFIDNSGRVWAMYYNGEAYFYVDTNGDKGPNLIGKDRWGFLLPNPRNSRTNKNFIVPCYDMDLKTKSWTCTSGDCKYKSWLIE